MEGIKIFKALVSLTPQFFNIVLVVLGILILNYLLDFLKRKVEKHLVQKLNEKFRKRPQTMVSVMSGSLKFIIVLLGILIILSHLKINVWPLVAGAGLASFAIGLAARDIISDFISGFFILLEDQYRLGDKVKIAGIEGTVKEITLRRTIIKDEEGFFHSIPNSQIKIVSKKD